MGGLAEECITREGNITTFFSFRGGVGKSVLATNFSIELARTFARKKVALVDLNIYNPDISIMLNIDVDKARTVKNYFEGVGIGVDKIVHKYEPVPNLDLFLSLFDLEWTYNVDISDMEKFIEELKANYDYIIFDTHPAVDFIPTFIPLKLSKNVICVATPDVPTIRNSDREKMAYLRKIGINAEIYMILTRYDNSIDIKEDMVKQETGIDNLICILEKPGLIANSINRGEPFILLSGKDATVDKIRNELQKIIGSITGLNFDALGEAGKGAKGAKGINGGESAKAGKNGKGSIFGKLGKKGKK